MSWYDIRNEGIRGLLISLIFLVLTITLSKTLDLGDWSHALLAAVILVCTLAVVSLVLAIGFRLLRSDWNTDIRTLKSENELLRDKFEQLSRVFKAEWLIPTSQVKRIESSTNATEVWIITASLEEELDSDQFLPIVSDNIQRGVRYRYFLPDIPLLRERGNVLLETVGKTGGLELEYVSHPLFNIIAMQDFGIFIPPSRATTKAQAFMNLPIKERGLDSFIALGELQTEILIAHLREFIGKGHNRSSAKR
jgi:hypothetical protein